MGGISALMKEIPRELSHLFHGVRTLLEDGHLCTN